MDKSAEKNEHFKNYYKNVVYLSDLAVSRLVQHLRGTDAGKRLAGADEWLRRNATLAQGEREQFNQFLAGRREKAASLPSEERDRLFQEFLQWKARERR